MEIGIKFPGADITILKERNILISPKRKDLILASCYCPLKIAFEILKLLKTCFLYSSVKTECQLNQCTPTRKNIYMLMLNQIF